MKNSVDHKELVQAMRWFRSVHPEYSRVRTMRHGWFGHCVFADCMSERGCVALVRDVIKDFRIHNHQ
jgi:hypothetical protein